VTLIGTSYRSSVFSSASSQAVSPHFAGYT
jgi:hypothetical protein